MNLRSWLIIVGIIAMSILNAFIISNEHIEISIEKEMVGDYEDRFGNLIYTQAERENNLKSFGLDEKAIKRTLKQIGKYERRYKDPFRARLIDSKNIALMTEIFCPRDVKSIRPRYAAARLLIKEKSDKRLVIDPKKDVEIIEQDWTKSLSFLDIYENIEKTKEELPYSTVMVIAAFLTKNEESLSRREEPWGRVLDDSWSWNSVQEEYPTVGAQLIKYFALMHLFTEIANDEKGVCK
jgi:hypothetical protein